ncbi:hypothetical protein [Oryza sativa Japonica Group]|uniref:Uncharacterized protein n=2 Tax=Oryza sativa subsp. japonica TaxID=39947 RepID=Q5QN42_ORYSJ|nr:hypothetical protein [Oryza sativa Japonica Group]BAD73163.1 hypothetical protein [Oryza sativa Japonica Group]
MASFALRLRWLWLQRSRHPYRARPQGPPGEERLRHVRGFHLPCAMGRYFDPLLVAPVDSGSFSVAFLVSDLFLAVPPHLRATRTVASALADNSLVRDIRGALTVPVISQFLLVWDAVLPIQLSPGTEDSLELETANHILLDDVFAGQVWHHVLSPSGWSGLIPSRGCSL